MVIKGLILFLPFPHPIISSFERKVSVMFFAPRVRIKFHLCISFSFGSGYCLLDCIYKTPAQFVPNLGQRA